MNRDCTGSNSLRSKLKRNKPVAKEDPKQMKLSTFFQKSEKSAGSSLFQIIGTKSNTENTSKSKPSLDVASAKYDGKLDDEISIINVQTPDQHYSESDIIAPTPDNTERKNRIFGSQPRKLILSPVQVNRNETFGTNLHKIDNGNFHSAAVDSLDIENSPKKLTQIRKRQSSSSDKYFPLDKKKCWTRLKSEEEANCNIVDCASDNEFKSSLEEPTIDDSSDYDFISPTQKPAKTSKVSLGVKFISKLKKRNNIFKTAGCGSKECDKVDKQTSSNDLKHELSEIDELYEIYGDGSRNKPNALIESCGKVVTDIEENSESFIPKTQNNDADPNTQNNGTENHNVKNKNEEYSESFIPKTQNNDTENHNIKNENEEYSESFIPKTPNNKSESENNKKTDNNTFS